MKSILTDSSALLAGALLPLAFAPFAYYPLAILAPAVLLLSWLQATPRRAFWRGWLFGVGFYAVGVSWIYVSLHVYGNASIFFASFAVAVFTVFFALYPAVQGYLLNRFFPLPTPTPATASKLQCLLLSKCLLAFPASWVLFEWLRSWLFTGFPWLLLGYSQINSPLRGLAPIFSVYAVSLATALSSGALISIFYLRHNSKRYRILLILMLAILWLASFTATKIHWTQPHGKKISVSLIQGNIPQQLKWQPEQIQNILATYWQMTQQTWGSDLIVWPECAIVIDNIQAKDYLRQLDTTAKQHHSSIIAGIPIYQNFQYYNGIIALGNASGYYLKRHLLPFGEYLPLRSIFSIFKKSVAIPMSDFSHGKKSQPNLVANGVTLGAAICYEIVFPTELLNALPSAQLLVLVTDDSWFGDSIALPQHVSMAQMRALETGRYLLFSSNDGITAIINAQGQVQSSAPPFQAAVLKDTVQPMSGSTPFVRWSVYPLLLGMLSLLILAWLIARKK